MNSFLILCSILSAAYAINVGYNYEKNSAVTNGGGVSGDQFGGQVGAFGLGGQGVSGKSYSSSGFGGGSSRGQNGGHNFGGQSFSAPSYSSSRATFGSAGEGGTQVSGHNLGGQSFAAPTYSSSGASFDGAGVGGAQVGGHNFGGQSFAAPNYSSSGASFGGAGVGGAQVGGHNFGGHSFVGLGSGASFGGAGVGGAQVGVDNFGGHSFSAPSYSSSGASFGSTGVGGTQVGGHNFGGQSFAAPTYSSSGASFGGAGVGGVHVGGPSFVAQGAVGSSFDTPATVSSSYTAPVENSKEFYTYTAPEQEFNDIGDKGQLVTTKKKNLRVIFIKGPENNGLENAALQLAKSVANQQTAIYVLSKQSDIGDLAKKLQSLNTQNSNKPEVHFVKYRTSADAEKAQHAIQSQYDSLTGPSISHDGGVTQVLNFVSNPAPAPAAQQSYSPGPVDNVENAYLPPIKRT